MAFVQWSAFPFEPRRAAASSGVVRSRWSDEGESFVLTSRLQGFRKRDISVTLDGDVIELSARRSVGWLDPIVSSYEERVSVPPAADPTTLSASFVRGDLVVRVAKLPTARPRRFMIHVAGEPDRPGAMSSAAGAVAPGVWTRAWQWVQGGIAWLGKHVGGAP